MSDQIRVRDFLSALRDPGAEFSQAPFWFWNDDLTEDEIACQMADFRAHGVYGFVIHPRAGLPRSIEWMSEPMIGFMRFAVLEAERTGMWVVLYDEGMYPSGSSSGQVVAENPNYRPHGLFVASRDDSGELRPQPGEKVVATVARTDGQMVTVVDRPIGDTYSVIRGLHYIEPDPVRRDDRREVEEILPPAADILNPDAVSCFIRLVYQRYYDEMGDHFGSTIRGIFTDEPALMGRRTEPGAVPGNRAIVEWVSAWLGYDFTPNLPCLWFDDEPDADRYRSDYATALQARLEETYYRPLSQWCAAHGVALTGHPAEPDDIGQLKFFQIPGQDIVLRSIEPDTASALEGPQSTQAKCASSAMIHHGLRRNSNEYCGAYGHDFTFDEMKWLARWLLVRGCNLLYPHAFYYSVRGPRVDERPPDVGPNSPWWDEFGPFADETSALCWVNTDSVHVCSLAILGLPNHLPWASAKTCFQHQYDFNYLEARHLWEDAHVTKEGLVIGSMCYRGVIVETEVPPRAREVVAALEAEGRIIRPPQSGGERELLDRIAGLTDRDVRIDPPRRDIRVRHVKKDGVHCYLLFNEGAADHTVGIAFAAPGSRLIVDPGTGDTRALPDGSPLLVRGHEMVVAVVDSDDQLP